ncbi:MAG: hypothetical protein H6604_03885 [Flavobacteriales bacterium]|nr:hypothetical protein [Flavobacteriales bacterium]
MEIDIRNIKIELIQWLTTLEDSSIIQKIVELRKNEINDWWYDIPEVEKKSIELGISDAESGSLKPNSEAREIYNSLKISEDNSIIFT